MSDVLSQPEVKSKAPRTLEEAISQGMAEATLDEMGCGCLQCQMISSMVAIHVKNFFKQLMDRKAGSRSTTWH